ncbi:hypothetical protein BDY19DRAFT_1089545 [Irpex rosettiformis]|uniref:Uncharacterized protein n=1 Tax=Irpex rosettiformis TaxID=378272 RepID=A0ACB8U3S3_9APHY|nr:hypothetical protein BDY19DRAFT_1089545 [Irpex rosettiformis]
MLDLLPLPEPPTQSSLTEARRNLETQKQSANNLASKIRDAEQELERIVRESHEAIKNLEQERAAVEGGIARTLAYLSPIRRLPHELLRLIFTLIFEDYPCCAWVLSAVCQLWRREALSMPRLWTKIRLVTTQNSSPDTVRLWLERSGPTVPLDIEIFLHSSSPHLSDERPSRRRVSPRALSPGWDGTMWTDWPGQIPGSPDGHDHGGGQPYVQMNGGALQYIPMAMPQPNTPILVPHVLPHDHYPPGDAGSPQWRGSPQSSRSRGSNHWGHIAFYYLTEQMHRWTRFVFRFDRQFNSVSALKSIAGDAPLLREFEVSCAEPGPFNEWTWIPCTLHPYQISQVETLTLQHVPFRWFSPIFQNLRSLSLRSLPTCTLALDRILHIIKQNPNLESLSLYFATVSPAVLPLVPVTMENLKSLSVGGHFMLTTIVDSLCLPALECLVFDVDTRDAVEETISSLLDRSQTPPIEKLSIAYSSHLNGPSGIFYGQGAMVTSWQFLLELEDLQILQVGGSVLEPLVVALGTPEDDNQDRWFCPNLSSLALRNCRAHGDGRAKLVHMVDARNPETGGPVAVGGVTPVKLRHLELHDCGLGQDVISWLDRRVESVVCMEPFDARSPRSPTFHYIA